MRKLFVLATMMACVLPATAGADTLPSCSTTRTSLTSVVSAVGTAAPGDTVCLADGTYGKLMLNATKAAPGVTIRAEHPGQASIAGASLNGAYLTIAQFRLVGSVIVTPGASGMTISHNFFDMNAFTGHGIDACPSSSTTCNDESIVGNRFVGRSEEDVIRANRYHDGPDADPYGLLVEGNEFTGNTERGDHNDTFQSVWVGDGLYFRKNYLHDFGGQGFFVKDQASAISPLVAEDNLVVNQNLPCEAPATCNFQLSPWQIYGPVSNVSMRHNTVGWDGAGVPGGGAGVLTGTYTNFTFSDNVFNIIAVTGGNAASGSGSNNTRCTGNGWPAPPGTTTDCSPAFLDPTHGDWRLANGRGVTWKVSDQQFGPVTTGPPPPPADTDGDGVPDSSDACPNEPGTQPDGCPPPPPPPGCDATCEQNYKDQIASLTQQLADMTTSRDNVQTLADAYKARALAAEDKLNQIHTLSAP